MKNPRQIDGALVDAYLARRALDYLVGFTLSPVLWRKLPGARSAGRVQSVALRLVCDRELEIEKFVAARILVAGRDAGDAAQRHLRGAPRRRRRQEDPAARHRHRRGSRGLQAGARDRRLHGRVGRGEAGAAQSAAALHHLDAAAGSQPQARLRARRTPCGSRSGSMKASTSAARPSASSPICVPTACRWRERRSPASAQVIGDELRQATTCRTRRATTRPRPKNAQEAHEAIRPTDLSRRPRDVAQVPRCRAGQALRTDLDCARSRARWNRPNSSAPPSTSPPRPARARSTCAPPAQVDQVRRLPDALSGRPATTPTRTTRVAPPARDERRARRCAQARDRVDAAFHRAAAALLRSLAGQAHGRARHRPALDLCLDPAGAEGPRLCAARQEAPLCRGQGPRRRRRSWKASSRATSNTISPRRWKSSSTGLEQRDRLARGAARLLGATSSARSTRSRSCASREVLDALDEMLGPHIFPPRDGRQRPAALPDLRRRASCRLKLGKFGAFVGCSNYPECRYTRQLAGRRRRRRRRPRARPGSGDRPRRHGARRPLRPLRPARRRQDAARTRSRSAPGLPKGIVARTTSISNRRSRCSSLPREVGTHPESGEPIMAGIGRFGPYVQHGKTYANLEAGDDVLTIGLNRAVTLIAEKIAKGPGRGRFGPIPASRSAIIPNGRADRGEERPLRPLRHARRRQRDAARRQDAGDDHARRGDRADRRARAAGGGKKRKAKKAAAKKAAAPKKAKARRPTKPPPSAASQGDEGGKAGRGRAEEKAAAKARGTVTAKAAPVPRRPQPPRSRGQSRAKSDLSRGAQRSWASRRCRPASCAKHPSRRPLSGLLRMRQNWRLTEANQA